MKKLLFVILLFPRLIFTSDWTGTSGDWNNAGNWSAGVPNAADAIAVFPSPGGSYTITLDISPTVGTFTVTGGASAYTFSP